MRHGPALLLLKLLPPPLHAGATRADIVRQQLLCTFDDESTNLHERCRECKYAQADAVGHDAVQGFALQADKGASESTAEEVVLEVLLIPERLLLPHEAKPATRVEQRSHTISSTRTSGRCVPPRTARSCTALPRQQTSPAMTRAETTPLSRRLPHGTKPLQNSRTPYLPTTGPMRAQLARVAATNIARPQRRPASLRSPAQTSRKRARACALASGTRTPGPHDGGLLPGDLHGAAHRAHRHRRGLPASAAALRVFSAGKGALREAAGPRTEL